MMKRTLILSMMIIASLAGNVRAEDEDAPQPDARLQGYDAGGSGEQSSIVQLGVKEGRGGAVTWFVLIGLGIVGVGVMFKSGKRSHLD